MSRVFKGSEAQLSARLRTAYAMIGDLLATLNKTDGGAAELEDFRQVLREEIDSITNQQFRMDERAEVAFLELVEKVIGVTFFNEESSEPGSRAEHGHDQHPSGTSSEILPFPSRKGRDQPSDAEKDDE